jgi:hypothetical protein
MQRYVNEKVKMFRKRSRKDGELAVTDEAVRKMARRRSVDVTHVRWNVSGFCGECFRVVQLGVMEISVSHI